MVPSTVRFLAKQGPRVSQTGSAGSPSGQKNWAVWSIMSLCRWMSSFVRTSI